MQRTCRLILAFLVLLPVVFAQSARERNAAQEWPTYNRDLAGTRYSPLNQINTRNVSTLVQAWVYRPSDSGGRASAGRTPLVVDGGMYLTAGNPVVALQPVNGKEGWRV